MPRSAFACASSAPDELHRVRRDLHAEGADLHPDLTVAHTKALTLGVQRGHKHRSPGAFARLARLLRARPAPLCGTPDGLAPRPQGSDIPLDLGQLRAAVLALALGGLARMSRSTRGPPRTISPCPPGDGPRRSAGAPPRSGQALLSRSRRTRSCSARFMRRSDPEGFPRARWIVEQVVGGEVSADGPVPCRDVPGRSSRCEIRMAFSVGSPMISR